MALVAGVGYGLTQFAADLHYTRGANQLRMDELEIAAALFPFSHEYRIGPARLVIRDNVWNAPGPAARRLRETMRYDPYSKWLRSWIATFDARAELWRSQPCAYC